MRLTGPWATPAGIEGHGRHGGLPVTRDTRAASTATWQLRSQGDHFISIRYLNVMLTLAYVTVMGDLSVPFLSFAEGAQEAVAV
ncbi:hypothetical protein GCM10009661_27320 [Catellatospora chokoriensis]|uniref:Uncharacterized protein n=1 Tax=Catellatospora chokoriensis TaxID=310353 RepID=A0A8J3K5U2_9ACTN|nr:hypothetical protein Cch02nite_67810 [Catellatospora chokoriensis]